MLPFGATIVAVVLAMVGAIWAVRRREQTKLLQALPACHACGGSELVGMGPSAYSCKACGYEGGEGNARVHAEERRARFARLGAQQRSIEVRTSLQEAFDLAGATLGELEILRRQVTAWHAFDVEAGVEQIVGIGAVGSAAPVETERLTMTATTHLAAALAALDRARDLSASGATTTAEPIIVAEIAWHDDDEATAVSRGPAIAEAAAAVRAEARRGLVHFGEGP